MSDHVYTADGRRLYTMTQLAETLGVTHATVRSWRRRDRLPEPDVWLDGRTPLWTKETASMDAPIHLSSKRVPGMIVAVGSASTLAAAYQTGEPVTLAGQFAGERVYLGHTRQTWDDGVTVETLGQAGETWTDEGREIAAYHVDLTRLQDAPRLAELVRRVEYRRIARAMEAEARAAAEERELDRSEDGA